MAHNAKLTDLTAKLIESIAGDESSNARVRKAVKTLREHNFARTNQFAVKARLEGLGEKFAIFGRDELAHALSARLAKLSADEHKFLPDKLALLVNLSDRPHEKVARNALQTIENTRVTALPELTWEEILHDDPLSEPELWEDVQRGHHSSGDDAGSSSDEESPPTSTESAGDNAVAAATSQLIESDTSGYEKWLATIGNDDSLTELDLCRETLLMLRGVRSVVYEVSDIGDIRPTLSLAFNSRTTTTLKGLLHDFSSIGTTLVQLRRWTEVAQRQACVRTCQSEIRQLLCRLANDLRILDEDMCSNRAVVSLLALLSQVKAQCEVLLDFAGLLQRCRGGSTTDQPFLLLDTLLEAINQAHATGSASKDITALFFAALTTYLRPTRLWCLEGRLSPDEANFFVKDHHPDCTKADIWTGRFELVRGDSTAPAFMDRHLQKLFDIGKEQVLINLLWSDKYGGKRQCQTSLCSVSPEVYMLDAGSSISLFAHDFSTALKRWIESMAQAEPHRLPQILIQQHGLLTMLGNIVDLYLAGDGGTFADASQSVLKALSRPFTNVNQRSSALTAAVRGTISSSSSIEAASVSISCSTTSSDILSMLKDLTMRYTIPWQLQCLFEESLVKTYSPIWILLLQIQYAKSVLRTNASRLRRIDTTSACVRAVLRTRLHLLTTLDVVGAHVSNVCVALHKQCVADLTQTDRLDGMIKIWRAHCARIADMTLTSPALATVQNDLSHIFSLCELTGRSWQAVTQSKRLASSNKMPSAATIKGMLSDLLATVDSMVKGLHDFSSPDNHHDELFALTERLQSCNC